MTKEEKAYEAKDLVAIIKRALKFACGDDIIEFDEMEKAEFYLDVLVENDANHGKEL